MLSSDNKNSNNNNDTNNKVFGKLGELAAEGYLKQKGFKILEKNFRCIYGEIDIIAFKKNTLHFIEVKSRRFLTYGEPLESINYKKIEKIRKCASHYITNIAKNNYGEVEVSFDAITFKKLNKKTYIQYLPNVF